MNIQTLIADLQSTLNEAIASGVDPNSLEVCLSSNSGDFWGTQIVTSLPYGGECVGLHTVEYSDYHNCYKPVGLTYNGDEKKPTRKDHKLVVVIGDIPQDDDDEDEDDY